MKNNTKDDIYIKIKILQRSVQHEEKMIDWMQSRDDISDALKDLIKSKLDIIKSEKEELNKYKKEYPEYFI